MSLNASRDPITINLVSDGDGDSGADVSVNELSPVDLVHETRAELEDLNKTKKDFLHIEVDFKEAMRTENCKMWALPVKYTSLLGKYHLAKLQVELKKQNYRKKQLICLGKTQEFLDGTIIGRDLNPVSEEQRVRDRNEVVALCRKMAVRCGGLAKLRARSDDCSAFLEVCASNFNVSEEELEGRLLRAGTYSQLPEFVAMKAAKKELDDAKKQDKCFFWEVKDVSLLGKTLLAQMKFYLRQQELWKNDVLARGASPEIVQGANLGPDLVRLTQEEEASYRYRVLAQCGHLSFRCGGLESLRKRDDDCSKFLQLAIEVNNFTPKELETAHSNYREVAAERVICAKKNNCDVPQTPVNSVIDANDNIKL